MVRITNARRPRMRPRSSLAPIAEMPPKAWRMLGRRRGGPDGAGGMAGSVSTLAGVSTGSIVTSVIVSSSRRFHGFAVRRGDLQEQLLEVAGGTGEADHGDPRGDGLGEQPGGGRVVAAEPELDRAVLEDRRRGDVDVGRESLARGRDRLAIAQDLDPPHGPEAPASLDVADPSLREHLAAVDDRDAGAQLLELGKDVAADEDGLP